MDNWVGVGKEQTSQTQEGTHFDTKVRTYSVVNHTLVSLDLQPFILNGHVEFVDLVVIPRSVAVSI